MEKIKMAYNGLKEYYKWRRWKDNDEKMLREHGVDEETIAKIRDFDRITYNSNNRFYKRLNDMGEFYEEIIFDKSKDEITSVEQLLQEVENPKMYKILKKASERTLQIILMRVQGYSVKDISEIIHISKASIYERISTLRNKLKEVM